MLSLLLLCMWELLVKAIFYFSGNEILERFYNFFVNLFQNLKCQKFCCQCSAHLNLFRSFSTSSISWKFCRFNLLKHQIKLDNKILFLSFENELHLFCLVISNVCLKKCFFYFLPSAWHDTWKKTESVTLWKRCFLKRLFKLIENNFPNKSCIKRKKTAFVILSGIAMMNISSWFKLLLNINLWDFII